MNDRIRDLLVDEVDSLDIPAPPTPAILAGYKAVRRRRRIVTGVGAVAAATVLGVVANLAADALTNDDASDRIAGTDSTRGKDTGYVQIAGYVDTEGTFRRIDVPAAGDEPISALSYSPRGVVATFTDQDGFSAYALVARDGSAAELSLDPAKDGAATATAPDEPYLAQVRLLDGDITVLVHDLVADRQVARVTVAESEFPGEKHHQFQVSYSDGKVYLRELGGDTGTNGTMYVVDWRSGDVREPSELADAVTVAGDHAVLASGGDDTKPERIVDVASGDTVLDIPERSAPADVALAPDGQHALVRTWLDQGVEVEMYDLATGEHHRLPNMSSPAWSEGSDIAFEIASNGTLVTCRLSGSCEETKFDLPPAKSIGIEVPGAMGYEF